MRKKLGIIRENISYKKLLKPKILLESFILFQIYLFHINHPNFEKVNKKEYIKHKIEQIVSSHSGEINKILSFKEKLEQKICDGKKYLKLKLDENFEECKNPDLETILAQTGKETKKIINF